MAFFNDLLSLRRLGRGLDVEVYARESDEQESQQDAQPKRVEEIIGDDAESAHWIEDDADAGREAR